MLVQLVGNVVENATKRTPKNNKTVINFKIALNYKYKDAAGNLKNLPTFIECEYWKDSDVYEFISKGRPVVVYGRIYPYAYTNSQGEAKGVIRCNVNTIELLSGGNSDQPDQTGNDTPSNEEEGEKVKVLEPVDDLSF